MVLLVHPHQEGLVIIVPRVWRRKTPKNQFRVKTPFPPARKHPPPEDSGTEEHKVRLWDSSEPPKLNTCNSNVTGSVKSPVLGSRTLRVTQLPNARAGI